jgi:hypothetical protein
MPRPSRRASTRFSTAASAPKQFKRALSMCPIGELESQLRVMNRPLSHVRREPGLPPIPDISRRCREWPVRAKRSQASDSKSPGEAGSQPGPSH